MGTVSCAPYLPQGTCSENETERQHAIYVKGSKVLFLGSSEKLRAKENHVFIPCDEQLSLHG